jgi:sugar-specific transcriptional regulator TrmB
MNTFDLTNIGLTEKESTVYIALLELGASGASDVASHSGIQRTTVYQTMDGLVEKGLVMLIQEGAVQKFLANPPSSIIQWSQKKYDQEKERLDASRNCAANLEKEFPFSTNSFSKVYNIAELGKVLQDCYQKTQTVRMFGSVQGMYELVETYLLKKIFKEAALRLVTSKFITTDTDVAIRFSRSNYLYNRETIVMSHINEPRESVIIFDSVVLLIDTTKQIITVLHQPVLANMMRTMYEYMWTRCSQVGIYYALPEDIDKRAYPVDSIPATGSHGATKD